MVINVGFANFWEGFPTERNFFTEAIEIATGLKTISVDPEGADLIIWSVFGAHGERNEFSKLNKNKINWYYTGENYKPETSLFDLSFSFVLEELPKHFRLPIWWLYCDWSEHALREKVSDDQINPRVLHLSRNFEMPPQKAVSIFINNPENRRLIAVNEFEKYLEVAKFGGHYNNRADSKLSVGKNYLYNLCFENEVSPGYHTEKLLHAWSMGAVPLYLGASTVNEEFNSKSFINLNDFKSISDFVSYVVKMSDEDCQKMINEPLLNEEISLQHLYSRLRAELSSFFT
jgi:hypothetical protein